MYIITLKVTKDQETEIFCKIWEQFMERQPTQKVHFRDERCFKHPCPFQELIDGKFVLQNRKELEQYMQEHDGDIIYLPNFD